MSGHTNKKEDPRNDSSDEHYTCDNCDMAYCFNYANDNKICAGCVKKVNPDVPFDVIRLCINTTSEEEMMVFDYTPDEVTSIVTVLSHALEEWMTETDAYKKFRNKRGDQPNQIP